MWRVPRDGSQKHSTHLRPVLVRQELGLANEAPHIQARLLLCAGRAQRREHSSCSSASFTSLGSL